MPKRRLIPQMTPQQAKALAVLVLEDRAEKERPAHGGYSSLQVELLAAARQLKAELNPAPSGATTGA